ncbi:hypothetical protein OL548_13925 [Lysinibacillus sp. MHQ-1]|nr:hypothetical protein OL548_13925 [Lysinibacillus sp. MHQ-1]
MAEWLQNIGRIMPLYYAADALNGVMYKGYTFPDIILNLSILACFAIVFYYVKYYQFKKNIVRYNEILKFCFISRTFFIASKLIAKYRKIIQFYWSERPNFFIIIL